ncbi:topoisomerase C-terminal repeat-containing protein [Rummeliibacillus sp. NPDC094406]
MCTKSVTKEMKGFKSKKGTTFSAKLKLDQGKVIFAFN